MSNLIPFSFEGADIRVHVDSDGNPWWVAKDVCDVLDIGNPTQAMTRLDEDEKGLISNEGLGSQPVNIINEAGLWALVLGSRKEQAKTFKRWITHDVIPSIRKTGGYGNPIANIGRKQLAQMVLEAETVIEAQQAAITQQTNEIKLLAPKAETYDNFMSAGNSCGLRVFAKMLGTGPNKMTRKLREMGILYYQNGDNVPYQKYCDLEYFKVVPKPINQGGQIVNHAVTTVTPKGQEWLLKQLKKVG